MGTKQCTVKVFRTSLFVVISLLMLACNFNEPKALSEGEKQIAKNERIDAIEDAFHKVLQKHLDAVTNRDLETLESTLSPKGNMQLILPGTEMTLTTTDFMTYHKDWFAIPGWTFETKILNTEIGRKQGMAVVEIIYREPDRDGKPYFNRMIVSYDLKKYNGEWYFIKDHASSVEKSSDIEQ